jgi:hypothetical protein
MGGGGFMRGGLQTTPGGYGSQGSNEQRKCCLPVTIKQILSATEEADNDFIIDGKRPTNVCDEG